MSEDLYDSVDQYIEKLFIPPDPVLDGVLASIDKAGLPDIQISPAQGKFLHLLARLMRAERILELGTLAGYSTIWMARALPPAGKLVTLEFDAKHADVARANLKSAGLNSKVELIVGAALDTLPKLEARGEPPFDMTFIDADKENYPAYLDWAVTLSRPGSLVVADNVVRAGAVLKGGRDGRAVGARAFNEKLAADPRLDAVILQQVGVKGHDGLAYAIVK